MAALLLVKNLFAIKWDKLFVKYVNILHGFVVSEILQPICTVQLFYGCRSAHYGLRMKEDVFVPQGMILYVSMLCYFYYTSLKHDISS